VETAFLHLKKTVRGPRRALRGQSAELARQEAWALLLIHNITATAAARAAAEAGTDPRLIPFTAVLSLIRGHVAADTRCRHCGLRSARKSCQASADSPDLGAKPMNAGLPSVVMPQAASTGSAGEPGCIRKKLASRNR
jgi:hypothetical protein